MKFLSPTVLAPIRIRLRIGVGIYQLRAPIDLTILSLLEIQRAMRLLQEYGNPAEQEALFFGIIRDIFLDPLPADEDLQVDDCVPAIIAFFDQLKVDDSEPVSDESKPAAVQPEDVDYGLPAARLASQYGGGVWHWLAEAPLPVFNYAKGALGPLQAEESMGLVTIGALGNGLVEKDRSQTIMADWERIALRLRKPEKREPDTMAELSAKFQLAGMAVEVF